MSKQDNSEEQAPTAEEESALKRRVKKFFLRPVFWKGLIFVLRFFLWTEDIGGDAKTLPEKDQ